MFDTLLQTRQQKCHRHVLHVKCNSSRHSKACSMMSSVSATTILILVSVPSLLLYNNAISIQALQPSVGLPPPAILQQLLQSQMDGTLPSHEGAAYDGPILLPCCYDGLTARLIARHTIKSSNGDDDDDGGIGITGNRQQQRFQATFMSGFGVSAVHGIPDTQLISYHEMLQSCTIVAEALQSVATEQELPYPIPCIAVRILTI